MKMSRKAYEAARQALYASYGPSKPKKSKQLTVNYYSDGSREKYPSLDSGRPVVCGKNSVMDPANLKKESPEVRAEILAKASRIVPLYNKGAVQYNPELD